MSDYQLLVVELGDLAWFLRDETDALHVDAELATRGADAIEQLVAERDLAIKQLNDFKAQVFCGTWCMSQICPEVQAERDALQVACDKREAAINKVAELCYQLQFSTVPTSDIEYALRGSL